MSGRILFADDEEHLREACAYYLRDSGFTVDEASNGKEAFDKILASSYDLVITDIEMPQMNGIQLLEKITGLSTDTLVIVITAYGSVETAVRALRAGANDYILKPIDDMEELVLKVQRLFQIRSLIIENRVLRREVQRQFDYGKLIGKSAPMKRVFDMIQTVSPTDSTVLITGNSGTGKELIARAIHFNSKRKDKPFIAINCGAISESLIESELFGHRRGSFTGAVSDKEGYLKAADGGTIFLDEISEMPLNLQVKLLRVIQEREFLPVGSTTPMSIDIRILASTNRNLLEEIGKERFREDLYYRINVVEVHLPSLKQRKEDIPLLTEFFIHKYRKELGKKVLGIEHAAVKALMRYDWRGEIRELQNVVERAMIFCKGSMLTVEDLPEVFLSLLDEPVFGGFTTLDEFVKNAEREYIEKVLERNGYDKEKAAKVLNLGLSTLYRKIRDLEIETE